MDITAPGCMVSGDPSAPLLVIGMAPGREEIANGSPFVGGSGRLLWKQLAKKAGISRADCYIVNCIGQLPEGSDGNPTKAQFDKWWDTFDQAVGKSHANVAFLLGGAALYRFTGIPKGPTGIEDWRGYIIERSDAGLLTRTVERIGAYKTSNSKRGITKGDPRIIKTKEVVPPPWPETVRYAIPSLHPAAILRTGMGQLPALASDAARVGRAVRGEITLTRLPWVEFLPSPCVAGGPVAFDIETGGIDNSIITRLGVACAGGPAWTMLWGHSAREGLKRDFGASHRAGSRGPAVAFNIGFDAPRLEAHGVPIPEPWWDVMLAAATCQPDLKKSLNFVASLYMDLKRWKHLADAEPARYNALDVAITLELYYILRAELERTGQLGLFEKRMMPTMPVLVEMTTRGITVDNGARAAWVEELEIGRRKAMEEWEQLAPGQKTSGKRLNDWLYSVVGLPAQYHKHGGITSEVSGLKKLLAGHLAPKQRRIIEVLLVLRGIEKELRTYAEVEIAGDGCIHPGFLPAGKDDDAFGKGIAGTGRITASHPNIQNQPQSARRMYIARPGMVLWEADWSQAEARILAELSGDDELKRAIAEGLHESNMRVLGVDKTRAKNGFYGWAYGAGKRTLHNTFIGRGFNVPESECEALLRGFDRRFVRAAAHRRRIAAEVTTRFYLTNAFGRRRYLLGGSRDVPAGLDFDPQSDVADAAWTILRPLRDQLRDVGGQLLAWNHDSALGESPAGQESRTDEIVRAVMEQPFPELGGLSIPVEIKRGPNWGDMK